MRTTRLLAAASAALLAAPGAASAAHATGALRVLHASPDAPAVDVYVNGAKTVPDLEPGAITPYFELAPGTYRWAIRVKDAPPTSDPVASGSAVVAPDGVATLAAIGLLRGSGAQAFRVRAIGDTPRRPFGAAKLKVVHLSPDTPPVDIWAQAGHGPERRVVSHLAYPTRSAYLTVPAGTYTFRVRLAGTPASSPAALTVPDVALKAGRLYTAWAIGALAPRAGELALRPQLTVDALPASFNRTKLRVLHASPDAPAVDVCIDGKRAIAGLAFGSAAPDDGSYLSLRSRTIAVKVVPAGAGCASAGVVSTRLPLVAQTTQTVVAAGELDTADPSRAFGLQLLTDRQAPIAAGKARLRVVHLSTDAPAVDVFAGGPAPLFGALAYPRASATLDVPAGSYPVSVRVAGGGPEVTSLDATLPAGTSTVVYAIGKAAPGAGEAGFRLKVLQGTVG